MTNTALHILQEYWGHATFRPPQDTIIEAVLAKKDTIALLPTGGGKSICFQIPALTQEGICIVISPLIALINDQVDNLKSKNIKAASIPSGTSQDEIITLFDNLKFGNYKFLYLSPERLQSKFIQQKISDLNVNLIAIDEAHCISEWGHDFRPSYRNINILRDLQPNIPFIALTASATQKVVEDIAQNLALKTPKIFKKSFFRENLAYQIYTIEDKLQRLKQIFTKSTTPAIVYVNYRKKTTEIAAFLNANGFKSSFYHGGLSFVEKQQAFENWMSEKTPIMVATNAFGMGIDKPNVGVVVHLHIPNSIENYIQEAGRAGRNGQKSFSVVLQNNNDVLLFKKQLENSLPSIQEIKDVYKKLHQQFQIAYGEFIETPFEFNFLDFCRKYTFSPTKVTAILKILHNNGILEMNQNYHQKSTVQFIVSSRAVLSYSKHHTKIKNFIHILLRSYGGLFEQETKIDEFFLAKKLSNTSHQVIAYLKQLESEQLITYNFANSNNEIAFLVPREDDKTINRISKDVQKFIKQKEKKAIDIITFITNTTICRSLQILEYFNEEKITKCGMCDVCLSQKKSNTTHLSENILQLLQKEEKLSSNQISALLHAKEKDILIHLRNLLSTDSIGINNQNKFYII